MKATAANASSICAGTRPPISTEETPGKCTAHASARCGIEPTPHAVGGGRFPVKYYVIAMLFIVFDIEIVFLYPWAVVYREQLAQNAALILGSMLSFVAILLVGYFYALRKGAFDWKS